MIDIRFLGQVDLRATQRPDDGGTAHSAPVVVRQPKRIALVAYLLLAPDGASRRRDTVLALLWPELDAEHGRAALRQLVHKLRRTLGPDAIVSEGDDDLQLGRAVTSDIRTFERAIAARQFADALEIYGGDLLAGLFVSGVASEFEQWLDGERDRLRCLAMAAAWTLADDCVGARNAVGAVTWARRALGIAPNDESALRRCLVVCDRVGDRAAAVRSYEEFSARLGRELELAPSPETQQLVRRVRERDDPRFSGEWITPTVPQRVGTTITRERVERRKTLTTRAFALIAATVMLSLALAITAVTRVRAHADSNNVLAVGAIRDFMGDTTGLTRVIGDMVTTGLASQAGLRVIGSARMYEVLAQLSPSQPAAAASPADFERAARAAGAAEFVEGSLFRQSGGLLRLDLRRIDLRTGTVRTVRTVTAAEPFALADSAVARFSDTPRINRGIAEMTTHFLAAYRLDEEGVRVAATGDVAGAATLFRASVKEDSTFARGVFHTALAIDSIGGSHAAAESLFARAIILTAKGGGPDRLSISARSSMMLEDPAFNVSAESLALRVPDDPQSHYLLGYARFKRGAFLEAIPEFERAIAMDSLGLEGKRADCTGCEAFHQLVYAYWAADSGKAAVRTARAWLKRRNEPNAWSTLAFVLSAEGISNEALAITAHADSLFPKFDYRMELAVPLLIQARRFGEADSLLRLALLDSPRARRSDAEWYLIISLRYQGRLREAVDVARRLVHEERLDHGSVAPLAYAQAQFEAQHFKESAHAAADFTSEHSAETISSGRIGRRVAWGLTHVAEARAAAGDTAILARLADSVQLFGERSGYGRDRLLHHHLRGLLWEARGRRDSAIGEFRRAIWSPSIGYTRSNLQLGRQLLASGKPREAAAALEPGLHGGIEASNLYLSPIEVEELLARAYTESGVRPKAAQHLRAVIEAWAHGDPPFRARADSARVALARLEVAR